MFIFIILYNREARGQLSGGCTGYYNFLWKSSVQLESRVYDVVRQVCASERRVYSPRELSVRCKAGVGCEG